MKETEWTDIPKKQVKLVVMCEKVVTSSCLRLWNCPIVTDLSLRTDVPKTHTPSPFFFWATFFSEIDRCRKPCSGC